MGKLLNLSLLALIGVFTLVHCKKDKSDVTPVYLPETVNIPAGTFTMGSPLNEPGRYDNETQHSVTLSAFKMSKYEITFAQYDAFCEATNRAKPNDEGWGRGQRPVISIDWIDATAFCSWLSEKTGKNWRLPTEAEWEYACRAGTTGPFNTGNNLTSNEANYDGTTPYNGNPVGINLEKTQEVGSYAANDWGLYDMHGNVNEWCSDWYALYSSAAQTNPTGSPSGSLKVIRGGAWIDGPVYCRSAFRFAEAFNFKNKTVGFRVVLAP